MSAVDDEVGAALAAKASQIRSLERIIETQDAELASYRAGEQLTIGGETIALVQPAVAGKRLEALAATLAGFAWPGRGPWPRLPADHQVVAMRAARSALSSLDFFDRGRR